MAWIAPLVAILFGIVYVTPVSPVVPTGCDYRGQHYQTDQHFQPSPCEHCFCGRDGQTACAVRDCPYMMCVDAVNDLRECCPVCPNGPTCRYNGMKDGESVTADAHITCHCVPPHVLCLPNPIGYRVSGTT